MLHWVAHLFGVDTQQSWPYDFWSGAGTQIGLMLTGFATYRAHTCHVHLCPRIGRHKVGDHMVCGRHNPGSRVRFEQILEVFREGNSGPNTDGSN